ncbi:Mucin [Candidatus Filomicrobium marinum]|uniref:Mucin n=2 Tax=Filomicrobium TaxID=119044 RepID=A0A0D6JEY2_9HYPH|nr:MULTISPECIES: hypothetical protein [Filomicrobium]MCV0370360.1 hypothetical protein [Filomicrobium sp.]CFX21394.1 Mucin [Candidatus Filomicrobium marinum]CPR18771.1 Mucin [Candidatus Filomicrobium marinum]SDO14515.1 hypothetical protein SAMN04488061_0398 [Filomicrobium insigne]
MRPYLTSALLILLAGAISSPAISQDNTKGGPPKSMGDEAGKLPATGTMSERLPEMGATPRPSPEMETGSVGPKGPAKTMGDEAGKLPATGNMSGAVPKMTTPEK